eukprot:scaffold164083_cov30-Tisochrysis_lutea.AAC.4
MDVWDQRENTIKISNAWRPPSGLHLAEHITAINGIIGGQRQHVLLVQYALITCVEQLREVARLLRHCLLGVPCACVCMCLAVCGVDTARVLTGMGRGERAEHKPQHK